MTKNHDILNHFLVDVFNEILKAEEYFIENQYKNLSVKEMHVIEAVCLAEERAQDTRATAIAEQLRITAGTLTTAVSTLEKKGYLLREKSETDRRVVMICATELGREANEFHKQFHEEMVDDVLEALTEEEATAFVRGLGNVSTFFRKKFK